MSESASPVHHADGSSGAASADLVRRFLELLQGGDIESAADLLSDDIRWINVSLPAIEGKERVRRVLTRAFTRPQAGFEVYLHKVAVDGDSVLTERTDVLIFGPIRIQIWVWGRFDVTAGRIVMWKDYFDFWNTTVATLRGLLGAAVPSLRPRPPAS